MTQPHAARSTGRNNADANGKCVILQQAKKESKTYDTNENASNENHTREEDTRERFVARNRLGGSDEV